MYLIFSEDRAPRMLSQRDKTFEGARSTRFQKVTDPRGGPNAKSHPAAFKNQISSCREKNTHFVFLVYDTASFSFMCLANNFPTIVSLSCNLRNDLSSI